MRYKYKKGIVKRRSSKRVGFILPLGGVVAGFYLLVNAFSPIIPTTLSGETAVVTKTVTATEPTSDENRLYIPKIGVDVAVEVGVTNETLEGGAWHRKPQNGDPKSGGNFVLAAHRFNLGFTPVQTRALSPFYHIDKLEEGDEIYADYDGQRYAYEVVKKYQVDKNAIEIEERSETSKMTLYSCDLGGPEAGRDVVEAMLIGSVAWDDGKPKIKTSL